MNYTYLVEIFGRDGDYTGNFLVEKLENGWEIFRCDMDDEGRPIYIFRKRRPYEGE
jgi:hypothetical protein